MNHFDSCDQQTKDREVYSFALDFLKKYLGAYVKIDQDVQKWNEHEKNLKDLVKRMAIFLHQLCLEDRSHCKYNMIAIDHHYNWWNDENIKDAPTSDKLFSDEQSVCEMSQILCIVWSIFQDKTSPWTVYESRGEKRQESYKTFIPEYFELNEC